MNNDNIIDFMENKTNLNNTFDFSQNWDNEFINVDEDEDVIISKNNKEDISFDDSFEDEDKILSIISEQPKKEIKTQPQTTYTSETTELDSFFDSIYNGVEDANELISQINLKKQTLQETEKEIASLKEQIAREKAEFSKYMDSQKQALETERKQLKEKGELQRMRLAEESAQVKNDTEVRNNELELREQQLKIEQDKLEMQKANFAKYKEVEEEKIKNNLNKLDIEKSQLEKEKELAFQTIENNRKEFEIEKQHFEKIKEIEQAKLKSERENLNKNCERFKRLITGLSTNFNKMPNE